MSKAKENAPTVQSQRVNGHQPPRIIARICESWGATPRTLLADASAALLAIAALYVLVLGMCAIDGVMHP